MFMHRRAMRALALGSALAAVAVPTTAVAQPMDNVPVVSQPAGQPTWQMSPQPLHDTESPAEGGGIGWSALAIGLGALGLTAGLAVVTSRTRLRTRRRRTPA